MLEKKSDKGWMVIRSKNTPTRMTRTSVSTVRTRRVSALCSKPCFMWTMILVSASSWTNWRQTLHMLTQLAMMSHKPTLMMASCMTRSCMSKKQITLSCSSGQLKIKFQLVGIGLCFVSACGESVSMDECSHEEADGPHKAWFGARSRNCSCSKG